MYILISGYYGFGNLGDELILKNIRNELERRFPGAGITVLSSCPADTRHCHGVNAISRWNPIRVSVAMWKSDLFILGGGGLIQDHTSSRSLLYYAGVLMLAWVFRVPSFLFSVFNFRYFFQSTHIARFICVERRCQERSRHL